jgi:hypothetical protein
MDKTRCPRRREELGSIAQNEEIMDARRETVTLRHRTGG